MQVNLGRPYEYDEGPPAAMGLFHRTNQPPSPPYKVRQISMLTRVGSF